MGRLTIIRATGDPDELLEWKQQHVDPVMKRQGGEYGHLAHVAARTDEGMIDRPVGQPREFSASLGGPGIQQAREAAGGRGTRGETSFEHTSSRTTAVRAVAERLRGRLAPRNSRIYPARVRGAR
jgi:hypothetical protein